MTTPQYQPIASSARYYAVRFKPGDDLLEELRRFMGAAGLRAATIVTCVGSLTRATLRFAHTGVWTEHTGFFEIVSLVGTLDAQGEHIHIAISDSQGKTLGAHLVPGSSVFTTAEVVLAELPELDFRREPCAQSGYPELIVERRQPPLEDE
ncbi:DNA-binding protein [Pseudomonas entomophila]|uniref:PPC domain-containing DNA-binding protein n=1 Tax=Pseudomonas entomophila TaxID=312306 RepID=UPI0023D849B8|nr:PPC domain-containing DNA-binding protein [Pseudomonas entomophila]MDF0731393.1 DNA-binding protein [Pseudomonas entomophila]